MRRALAVLGLTAMIFATPAFAASSGIPPTEGPLSRQLVQFSPRGEQPQSPDWTRVPGLPPVRICAQGPITVLFSAAYLGASPLFRWRVDGAPLLQPSTRFRVDPLSSDQFGEVEGPVATRQFVGVLADGVHTVALRWWWYNGNPDSTKDYVNARLTILYQQGAAC